jgi:hypothetical protein
MAQSVSQFPSATATGTDLVPLTRLSSTVVYTGTTISAAASDNSLNDSADQFVAEGFEVGQRINIAGFTGDTDNNFHSAEILSVTVGKIVLGADTVLVDDAAGESVTLAAWESRRSTAQDVADLAAPGGDVANDAIWDAAGDLAVGTGANTAAKLTMGSALQVLRVNAAGTALEWAAAAAGGSSMIISNPSGNFNRPGDTTTYAGAELVANSTTAGSVTPVAITVAGTAGAQVRLLRARLQKSGTTSTNAQFHVHVWRTAPTVANGDNGGFSPNNAANYLGRFTIGGMTALSDGCVGYGVPGIGLEVPIDLAGGVTQVHCLIEALAAYVPANAETFTITLDVEELT